MGLAIGILTPILGALTYYQSTKVAAIGNQISNVNLSKTKQLGELIFKFRDIRIQVRTVPVIGMSRDNIDIYLENTKKAVAIFLEAKQKYESQIENDQERSLYQSFDLSAKDFLEFGTRVISLSAAHDRAKLDEVSQLIRDVCPVKAEKVEKAIAALVAQQTLEANTAIDMANQTDSKTKIMIIVASVCGFLVALSLGYVVAKSISRELQTLADQLAQNATQVAGAAQQVSDNGNAISLSTTEQASALQQTVSAIEEISSMIAKNSENARQSKNSTASSLSSAQEGKDLVEQLLGGVQEIQKSTLDLMNTAELGNQEMTKIVNLINEIKTKTTVINDIVFQTKLLSFNASVEAARAGEAGKGFAVVAEEVGNLATMSGNAAKEISDILSNSVEMVEKIVSSTQERVEAQAKESKARVEDGIKIGTRCGESLTQILEGARQVDVMVTEITAASQEQSSGVSEVSKAMHKMDQVMQENANVSGSSASAAEVLSAQAQQMKSLVDQLYLTINGSTNMNHKQYQA